MPQASSRQLKKYQGVEEAHELYGVYDLLLKVKADSIDDLKAVTKTRIKKAAGVTNSLTLMVVDPAEKLP